MTDKLTIENPLDWRSRALLAESEEERLRAAYLEQVEHNRFAANKHSEHIHELSERLNELRAENERRQKALDDCVACLADERVENERLRAKIAILTEDTSYIPGDILDQLATLDRDKNYSDEQKGR